MTYFQWRANDKFSYGYVRAEVLAGFVNGLFLLFIAFFILSEVKETFKTHSRCMNYGFYSCKQLKTHV